MNAHTTNHGLMRSCWGAMLALLLALGCAPLWAQMSTKNFDHVKTGFALTGVHSSQRCESCHINGVFKGTPRDCASCHINGARLATSNTVKPPQHIPTQLGCENCHSTLTFTGARFNHMGVAPTSCGTCHNGMTASGKPAGHIMTTAPCGTCHRTTAWVPTLKPDHSLFTPATLCSTCHNGSSATGKPAGHIATAGNCIDCHRTTAWLPASKPDHSLFTVATNCSSCHNGSSATGKTPTHIPTAVNCIACHATTTWRPAKWNHTQQPVANQCSTCHSGAFPPADGRPANHIPYQVLSGVVITNCDSCHKTGYVSWFPGKFHSNVSVTMQCATCHLSSMYGLTSKPATATHATVTGFCESCHRSTSTWLSVQFTHSPANAVGTGTCDTCHNGMTALGKPVTHIPVTTGPTKCDSCHLGQTTFTAPYTMNHTVVSATSCKTCHNGSYTSVGTKGAQAKSSATNHIPEAILTGGGALDCNACHRSSTTSWLPERMEHNGSPGGGGQCNTCHGAAATYSSSTIMKMALNHRGASATGKTDCSASSCHKPLGSTGQSWSKWN